MTAISSSVAIVSVTVTVHVELMSWHVTVISARPMAFAVILPESFTSTMLASELCQSTCMRLGSSKSPPS